MFPPLKTLLSHARVLPEMLLTKKRVKMMINEKYCIIKSEIASEKVEFQLRRP